MKLKIQPSRREFLRESGTWIAGALVLSWGGNWIERVALAAAGEENFAFTPGPFIAIALNNTVTLVCHRSEMGQGARTSMAMLLAEELEVDWEKINLVQADADPRYGDQNTDGSRSVLENWDRLREAGAAAREVLIRAAAGKWRVEPNQCYAQNGRVVQTQTGQSLSYGDLVQEAKKIPLPKNPKLKSDSKLNFIGKPQPLVDIDAILAGKATFGIDVKVDSMVYASLERSPSVKGKIKSLDPAPALAIPGVIKVIPLRPKNGQFLNESVAVIGKNTWASVQGRKSLRIEWDHPPHLQSTSELRQRLNEAVLTSAKVYRNQGDFQALLEKHRKAGRQAGEQLIEAKYEAPYLVHAMLEPPVCVASVQGGKCEIWAPVQDPQGTKKAVAEILNIPEAQIQLHVTLLGGGFGRKSQPDFVLEAALLAKEMGQPVKVTWTREDEIQHGFYHAESAQQLTAILDSSGKIKGWRHRSAFTPIALFPPEKAPNPESFEMQMGCTNLPYAIPNILCEGAGVRSDLRVGWLRSVCNLYHSFAINSFLDEIAHKIGKDPVQLRLEMLKPHGVPEWEKKTPYALNTGRLARVLEKVVQESGYGKKRHPGVAVGVSCHSSFLSYVALALEVQIAGDQVRVLKADCAIDCGKIVNPDTVRAQMEGAIVFGLSAALYGEITVKHGMVEQNNFHNYPILRFRDAPQMRIHLVSSDAVPTGVGEPGVPPVAPALCSAVFQLTGKRIRRLPIEQQLKSS